MPDRSRQHRNGGLPPTPPLSPIDQANLSSQVTSLYQNYLDSRKLLEAQSTGLRGLFQTQQGGILAQRRQDLAANEGSMIERGLEGGTAQVTSEADIRGAATAQVAAARESLLQGLIANRGAAIQARRNYEGGLLNLKLAAGAQNDVQNIIDQMLQNTGPSGDGGGGGNGGGGGGGGGGNGGGGGTDGGGQQHQQADPHWGAIHKFSAGIRDWGSLQPDQQLFVRQHIVSYALANPGVFGASSAGDLISRFGLGNPPTDASFARWALIDYIRQKYAGGPHPGPGQQR